MEVPLGISQGKRPGPETTELTNLMDSLEQGAQFIGKPSAHGNHHD